MTDKPVTEKAIIRDVLKCGDCEDRGLTSSSNLDVIALNNVLSALRMAKKELLNFQGTTIRDAKMSSDRRAGVYDGIEKAKSILGNCFQLKDESKPSSEKEIDPSKVIGIQYSWQSDGSTGQWMNPNEVYYRLMPHQFFIGVECQKDKDGDLIIIKIGRKPHIDQAIRYIELEFKNRKKEDEKN